MQLFTPFLALSLSPFAPLILHPIQLLLFFNALPIFPSLPLTFVSLPKHTRPSSLNAPPPFSLYLCSSVSLFCRPFLVSSPLLPSLSRTRQRTAAASGAPHSLNIQPPFAAGWRGAPLAVNKGGGRRWLLCLVIKSAPPFPALSSTAAARRCLLGQQPRRGR